MIVSTAAFVAASGLLAQAAAAAAPAGGAAGAAGGGAAPESWMPTSVVGYIHAGGPLAYLLVVLSIVALGLIITNLIVLRRDYLAPPTATIELDRLLQGRQVEQAIAFCGRKENDSFLARVMGGGLLKASRSAFGFLELKPALELAGQREVDNLDRVTNGLAILAAIGPMLGLLGTVFGMILAFQEIGSAGGAARSSLLASHMALALVNTALGLIVAIPCTVAYAMFKRRTDRLAAHVAAICENLTISLQPTGPAGAARAGGPVAAAAPARAPAMQAGMQTGMQGTAGAGSGLGAAGGAGPRAAAGAP